MLWLWKIFISFTCFLFKDCGDFEIFELVYDDIDDELFCKQMEADTENILIETYDLLIEIRETVEAKLING